MRLQASQDGAFQSDQKKTWKTSKKKKKRAKSQSQSDFLQKHCRKCFAMKIILNLLSGLSKKSSEAPLQDHQTDLVSQLNKFEKGKDERPININLPPRPPFQALKYLIVLGQLCCFVGRASVDPFYKTTPVPAQWRPCLVAPHCPRNGRLQRILNFFPPQAAQGWQSLFTVSY